MTDTTTTSPRATFESLRAALHAPDASLRRDPLKAEIITLYKAVEREMAELAALKEEVKGLVQLWKALDDATGVAAQPIGAPLPSPEALPPQPATVSPTPTAAPTVSLASSAADLSDEAAVPPARADAVGSGGGARTPPVGNRAMTAGGDAAPASPEIPTRADHLNASTYLEKGWSLMSLGDHAGAEAALVRALELAPNDPHGESLLGWAQMLQEKYDDALLNFQKVLMRQPQNSLARINVGYICLKKKIFGEAIEHLSKAIRLDNDRKATLYAHYYLGLLYLEREMYEDAQNFLRKAIALGPNLIEAYYELGRAIFFAGDRDGAMTAWRDGARQNKFNPWGKRCAELLQHVEAGGAPPRAS